MDRRGFFKRVGAGAAGGVVVVASKNVVAEPEATKVLFSATDVVDAHFLRELERQLLKTEFDVAFQDRANNPAAWDAAQKKAKSLRFKQVP